VVVAPEPAAPEPAAAEAPVVEATPEAPEVTAPEVATEPVRVRRRGARRVVRRERQEDSPRTDIFSTRE
jgi:hypothetical protein